MKKRSIALVMAALMLGALCACGSEETAETEPEIEIEETVQEEKLPVTVTSIAAPWVGAEDEPYFTDESLSLSGELMFVAGYEGRDDVLNICVWNAAGDEMFTTSVSTWGGWNCTTAELALFCAESTDEGYTYRLLDYVAGEEIFAGELVFDPKTDCPACTDPDANGIVEIYGTESGNAYAYIDLRSGLEVTEASYDPTGAPSFDEKAWDYCIYSNCSGYLFAGKQQPSTWGFTDEAGNILAEYTDCSDFTINGYALASTDRESYFIIGTDFQPVNEETYSGCSAYCTTGGTALCLVDADGNATYFTVEQQK